MSKDVRVTKDLVQTCKDGEEGFAKAAAKLAESGRDDLAGQFREFSEQRGQFATELEGLAASYGDDAEKSSSVAAAIHRGWMTVKDKISGSDVDGVLDVAEQGEDHAKSEYAKALDEDISAGLRAVITRQQTAVNAAHDTVKRLRDTQS